MKTRLIIEAYEQLWNQLSFSAVQYMIFYIFTCIFTVTNSQRDQLPDGLIAQLVENCTGIAEVIGMNPVQA